MPVQKGKGGRKADKNMAKKKKVRKNMALTACPEECSKGKKKKNSLLFCMNI